MGAIVAVLIIIFGVVGLAYSAGRGDATNACAHGEPIVVDSQVYKCIKQKLE